MIVLFIRLLRRVFYRPPLDIIIIKLSAFLLRDNFSKQINIKSQNAEFANYLVSLTSSYAINTEKSPQFNDRDPISGLSFKQLHYKNLNYSTSDHNSLSRPDFLCAVIDHKHGYILRRLINIKEQPSERLIDELTILLKLWRNKYKPNHGLPYLISLTISQRLIHWSISVIFLSQISSNCNKFNFKKQQLIEWLITNIKTDLLCLIPRTTALDHIKNNFLIAECVAIIGSCYILEYSSHLPSLYKYIGKLWYKIFINFLFSLKGGQTNEGSTQYTKYILETSSLLNLFCYKFNNKILNTLYDFTSSYMWNDKSLVRVGDDSYEQFIDIFDRTSNHDFYLYEWLEKYMQLDKVKTNDNILSNKHATFFKHKALEFFLDHEIISSKFNYGGHSHFDYSSFQVRLNDEDMIVDPGTFSYHITNKRNDYREYKSHNIAWPRDYIPKQPRKRFGFDDGINFNCKSTNNTRNKKFIVRTTLFRENIEVIRSVVIDKGNGRITLNDHCNNGLGLTSHIHLHPSCNYTINGSKQLILSSKFCSQALVIDFNCDIVIKDYLFSTSYGYEELSTLVCLVSNTNTLQFSIYAK